MNLKYGIFIISLSLPFQSVIAQSINNDSALTQTQKCIEYSNFNRESVGTECIATDRYNKALGSFKIIEVSSKDEEASTAIQDLSRGGKIWHINSVIYPKSGHSSVEYDDATRECESIPGRYLPSKNDLVEANKHGFKVALNLFNVIPTEFDEYVNLLSKTSASHFEAFQTAYNMQWTDDSRSGGLNVGETIKSFKPHFWTEIYSEDMGSRKNPSYHLSVLAVCVSNPKRK